MRPLIPLALLTLVFAGCEVPHREDLDALRKSHASLLDSLRAVPVCSPRDYASDRPYHECRYRRETERLAIVRRSEYGSLAGATRYPLRLGDHLARVALTALDAGRATVARTAVRDAREALEAAQAEHPDDPGSWGEAAEAVAIVEGRLALAAGDTSAARRQLLAAGGVLAAPTQLSFGPNVTLARDLLTAGDTAGVRAYFTVLDTTWTYGAERVAGWRAALDRGASPDFGPNLVY